MDSLKERLKRYYSLDEEGYARICREPSFSYLPSLSKSLAALEAKSRIAEAIREGQRILIYGDYDCDGIMATSIMARALSLLGAKFDFYIPSRYTDGYGLTMENAKKILRAGYRLLICVDNGVSCLDQIALLLDKGVETIVIDHHDLPPALPPSRALIHDRLLQSLSVKTSAGALCFYFSCLLLGKVDEESLFMGATSVISDMMPMKGENALLVSLANRLSRQGVGDRICRLADSELIDERALSLRCIPAINAVGRIEVGHKARTLIPYFARLSTEPNGAFELLKEDNEKRKALSNEAEGKAKVDPSAPGCFQLSDLIEGLNGLLANRLLEKTGKPSLVLSKSYAHPGYYVGSMRGKGDFDCAEMVEPIKGSLASFGGHQKAAGLSLSESNLGLLKDRFLSYCRSLSNLEDEPQPSIPMELSEANLDSYRVIRSFGPFGVDHPEPVFELSMDAASLQYSKTERLCTPLGKGVRVFSFSLFRKDLPQMGKIAFSGTFSLGKKMGRASLTFYANSYRLL